MSVQLTSQVQEAVDQLLRSKTNDQRLAAVKKLVALPDSDKCDVEIYLIERLSGETDVWKRTWSMTGLAKLGLSRGVQTVLEHTTEIKENHAWVRHFALLNAAEFDPFPLAQIETAVQDTDPLVKATALRLLATHGEDGCANELRQMLQNSREPQNQWAAARVLRNRDGMRGFRDAIEAEFIGPLAEIAKDPYALADSRWEAVQSLSTVVHHQSAAAKVLGEILVGDELDSQRRIGLDALVKLNLPSESQDALLRAVEDSDAEIRVRACNGLKGMLGASKAAQLIVDRALDREKDTARLVEALRNVDPDVSARALQQALGRPDSKTGERAARLLMELGGQEAARILMAERTKVLDKYTELLGTADTDVMSQFKDLMGQAKIGFWMSLFMHGVIFLVGVVVLAASLNLTLSKGVDTFQQWIGIGGTASGLLTLLASFYRNPLENVRTSVTALMKVNIVFLGFVRQVNQIDATYKHQFLGNPEFGVDQMKSTIVQLQGAVKETLEYVKTYLAQE